MSTLHVGHTSHSLPEETLFCSERRFQSETQISCCMSKPSGPRSTPGAIPGHTGRRRSRPKSSQCGVRYVSVCKRILIPFTHPSIHATEAGFLQSGRYQPTHDESNFDFRQQGEGGDHLQSVLTDPEEHPTSYPMNNGDSSIGERLHKDGTFKRPKTGTLNNI